MIDLLAAHTFALCSPEVSAFSRVCGNALPCPVRCPVQSEESSEERAESFQKPHADWSIGAEKEFPCGLTACGFAMLVAVRTCAMANRHST